MGFGWVAESCVSSDKRLVSLSPTSQPVIMGSVIITKEKIEKVLKYGSNFKRSKGRNLVFKSCQFVNYPRIGSIFIRNGFFVVKVLPYPLSLPQYFPPYCWK